MTSEQQIPTTAEVREAYQMTGDGLDFKSAAERRGREFDAWLAERLIAPSSGQQYCVVADRDKGDDPMRSDIRSGDRVTFGYPIGGLGDQHYVVRIERPVPTTDSRSQMERESDALDALRATPVPVPHLPTREQIAALEALRHAADRDRPFGTTALVTIQDLDAVLALIQKGTDRG